MLGVMDKCWVSGLEIWQSIHSRYVLSMGRPIRIEYLSASTAGETKRRRLNGWLSNGVKRQGRSDSQMADPFYMMESFSNRIIKFLITCPERALINLCQCKVMTIIGGWPLKLMGQMHGS